jgi:hypothetical protein
MTGSDVVPPENWDEITAGSTGEQVTAPADAVQSLGAPMIWVTCTTLLRFRPRCHSRLRPAGGAPTSRPLPHRTLERSGRSASAEDGRLRRPVKQLGLTLNEFPYLAKTPLHSFGHRSLHGLIQSRNVSHDGEFGQCGPEGLKGRSTADLDWTVVR